VATEKMKRIYKRLEERWGEPTNLKVFDGKEAEKKTYLPYVHVAIWGADETCDVTAFNSLGTSEKQMKGANYYIEFHFAIRGELNEIQQGEVARFIANLTEYPFINDLKLDWWERLINPGKIPMFESCSQLVFFPSLVDNGLQTIDDLDGLIKLLYVVPITSFENHLLKEHGVDAFEQYIEDNCIDILSDRP